MLLRKVAATQWTDAPSQPAHHRLWRRERVSKGDRHASEEEMRQFVAAMSVNSLGPKLRNCLLNGEILLQTIC